MGDQDYATVSGTKVHKSDFAYAPEGSNANEWKLPIHDAAHVRNALARFEQTDLPAGAKAAALAKIHAAAKKFGVKYEGESEKSSDLTNVYDSRLAVTLSAARSVDGKELHELAVAPEGSWVKGGRKFSITAADQDAMVRNFEKRKNDAVVVDYEHASEQPEVARGGPVPASGWFRKLYREGGMLKALVEWTDEAKALIKSGAYRFFSPAIDWSAKDKETGEPQGATLTSGALTNHPFLEELPALALSERDLVDSRPRFRGGDSGNDRSAQGGAKEKFNMSGKTLSMKCSAEGKHQVFDGEDQIGEMADDHLKQYAKNHLNMVPDTDKDGMSDVVLTELGATGLKLAEVKTLVERGRKAEQLEREGEGRKQLLTAFAAPDPKMPGVVLLNEASAMTLARDGKISTVGFIAASSAQKALDAAVRAGKILPRERAYFLRDALDRPAEFAAMLADRPAAITERALGNPSGEPVPVDEEVERETKRLMSEHNKALAAGEKKITFGQAQQKLWRENPGLFERYQEAHRKPMGEAASA